MDRRNPAVDEEVAAVATRAGERLSEVTQAIKDLIQDVVLPLRDDERLNALLSASIQDNVTAGLAILRGELHDAVAPNMALEYARRLAQRDIGMTALLRGYRVGQTRILRELIEELLRGRESDHVEGNAALYMVEQISSYVDSVVEQVVKTYEQTREEWLSHRSAVFVQRIRTLLRERGLAVDVAQRMLGGYRLTQHHLGVVIWRDDTPDAKDSLSVLNRCSLALAEAAGCVERPLFVPYDEASAWLWLPLGERAEVPGGHLETAACTSKERTAVALGEPLPSLSGFRRTHRQALLAYAVAIAAKPPLSPVTMFTDVAPIAPMCADLEGARSWIGETLGLLAIDDERSAALRETARVFLMTGGSFTATANQMRLHRNTAQYRIRKAEELRGRPLREGRLDVELALLACHHLGSTVLQTSQSG